MVISLRHDDQNSSSANPRAPKMLMKTISAQNMAIQPVTGTVLAPSQYCETKPQTVSSRGRTMSH
jgi:hypothetical protein